VQATFVDLAFSPCIELVSMVREFVGRFYEHILKDEDAVSRVVLATHEILENAVKYSLDGQTRIRVEHRPQGPQATVVIQTWNRPRPDDLTALREHMTELKAAADPFAFYQRLLERASKRTDGSGLGLGRIWTEAEMTLSYDIEDGWVRVTAEAKLPASQAPEKK
jgi:hypothetical protein